MTELGYESKVCIYFAIKEKLNKRNILIRVISPKYDINL